ncbi:hypothetical protein EG68_01008 [Paragonimus skrjabini miyazakii]|uniref:Uncharacterized protein n=1 Tax=Paragonimus skrjabini miyazakii TaxID=59628 RepID=A0A8S9Z7Q7_9TREM|nr:hypothetical protein EG68_01008 [Paragonimus skrjabini miyazakii]
MIRFTVSERFYSLATTLRALCTFVVLIACLRSHSKIPSQNEVGFLIPEILDQLLIAYNARDLMDLARELATTVGWMANTTNYILSEQEKLVLGIQWFQGNMSEHQMALNESVSSLCRKDTTDHEGEGCDEFIDKLTLFNVNFNASQLLTEPSKALSAITSVFQTNMTQLVEQFGNLDGEVRNQTDRVLAQIRGQLDLQKQFQSLLNIWDSLSGNVMQPVVGQLDKLQPTVDSATKTVANVTPIVGYVLCVIYVLSSDSISDPKGIPRKSRYLIVLGQCLPLFAIIIVPILVVLGVILISVVGVLNNEGCRYVERDTGIRITDAALNLYLKYTWPKLIAQQSIDPKIISLLDLPAPQNVYSGLRFTCQRSVNGTTQPGLLPSVGLKNIVNVSAVVYQPDLQKVINDSEKALVDEIMKLNFSKVLPSNTDELFQSVGNITSNLKNANYSILTNQTAVAQPVQSIYRKSMDKLFRNLTRDLEQVMTRFTTNVLPCDRLNVIFVSVLNVACGSSGMLNRIGAYMFTVLLLACPLVLTVLLFQLFLRQHQRLCLNSGSQGIPSNFFER